MADSTAAFSRRVWREGELHHVDHDSVVVEVPVALVYNGVSHAVMMTTPADLDDLALGFSLSEGVLNDPGQLLGLEVLGREHGIEVAMEITAEPFNALKLRRRSLVGRSGCGLCGVESLQQAIGAPARVSNEVSIGHASIQRALESLAQKQELKRSTGGVHGAAWCTPDGDIQLIREDVGRHNALDKLLGALATAESAPGFVLLTSRLGYEMVAKAAACNVAVVAAVSAPTSLAIEQARAANMTLVGFAQKGRHVVYCGEQRIH